MPPGCLVLKLLSVLHKTLHLKKKKIPGNNPVFFLSAVN